MEKKFRLYDVKRKQVIATGIHLLGEFILDGGIDSYINNHCNQEYAEGYSQYINNIRTDIFSGKQDSKDLDIYENDMIDYEGKTYRVVFDSYGFFIQDKKGMLSISRSKSMKVIGIYDGK